MVAIKGKISRLKLVVVWGVGFVDVIRHLGDDGVRALGSVFIY